MKDLESSPLDEKHKVLFRYLEKLNADPAAITERDITEVKHAGWTEEAIYDALTVAALFRFYNTWIDGSGVPGLSQSGFEQSGARLGAMGYDISIQPLAIFRKLAAKLPLGRRS